MKKSLAAIAAIAGLFLVGSEHPDDVAFFTKMALGGILFIVGLAFLVRQEVRERSE